MGLTREETSGDSSAGFSFMDSLNSLEAQHRLPARIKTDFHEATKLARRFNDEVLRPIYQDIDRKIMQDNEYLPVEFIRKANEWGLYTFWIPKMYGGQGMNMLSLYPFMEEISSVCAGLANLIGAHYLGVSVLCSSCNIKVINRILRSVASECNKGNPCLISLAWTEPDAGTDSSEIPLLPQAKVRTQATKVAGGYMVNGSKVFISAGHVSTWHMLICYEDIRRPADTLIMLAVKNGMKGFTFGHKEEKMGQKACVASELIFEDCFVPDENVCFSGDQLGGLNITAREAGMKVISLFPPVSQPGVGSIGTGIARAACDAAIRYAAKKKIAGESLINQEWVQMAIADMYANVVMARALYMEAAYAAGLKSMIRLLFAKVLFYLSLYTPSWVFTRFVSPLFNLEIINRLYRKMNFEWTSDEDERHMSGLGALTKFSCTDIAVANCAKAIDLMGADGTRNDVGRGKNAQGCKIAPNLRGH